MSKKNDILSAVVVILFAAAFYAGSFRIQKTTSDVLGSRFFPQAAAILLVLLGIIQIATALNEQRKQKAASTGEENDSNANAPEKEGMNLPFLLTVAALFAYYILIRLVGFTITSISYLLFESWVLMPEGSRNSRKMKIIVIITSFLVPLFLNYVFYYVFKIKLPQGSLFG